MKPGILALTTLAIALSLAVPASAQTTNFPRFPLIRTESEEFFRRGRQQFEQEIWLLLNKSYFPEEDLLKIREIPPLEDGPFSVESSNAFPDRAGRSDAFRLPSQRLLRR